MSDTWNSAYELLPQRRDNPGYGADSIKGVKTNVRERVNLEHIMGQSETDLEISGGTHREGSAKATVDDDFSYSDVEPNMRMSTKTGTELTQIGQLKIDMITGMETLFQDEVIWTDNGNEQYNKIISVVMSTDTNDGTQLSKVFDWSEFVNMMTDQLINGLKTFIFAPRSEETVTLSDDLPDEDVAKMVRADELNAKYIEARDFNPFTDGGVRADESIYCDEVHATKVYGAVYG